MFISFVWEYAVFYDDTSFNVIYQHISDVQYTLQGHVLSHSHQQRITELLRSDGKAWNSE
jgi:hypothetical protein